MLDDSQTKELRTSLRGQLLCPEDSDYDKGRKVFNAMIDRRPALIARCTGAVDVIACVRFAQEQDLPVSIRGGGHSIAGTAVCDDGLVVDLSMMKTSWRTSSSLVLNARFPTKMFFIVGSTKLSGAAFALRPLPLVIQYCVKARKLTIRPSQKIYVQASRPGLNSSWSNSWQNIKTNSHSDHPFNAKKKQG